MRKIFIMLTLLCMCGCQRNHIENIEDPLYFVFATPLLTHPIWLQAQEGMIDACDELHVQCDWQGPIKISITEMNDVIHTALMKKADGIITQGVISNDILSKETSNETPFVFVDSPVEGANPLTTISKDFKEQATTLLRDIEKKVGHEKYLKIGIQVSDIDFDLAKQQVQAVQDVFSQHEGNFEIVAISESMSNQLRSRNEWIRVLQSGVEMNVSLNFASENAIGMVSAMDTLGYNTDILIYGVDDMEETVQLIQDHRIEGSVVTSFYQYGYQAVKILYDKVKYGISPDQANIATNILLVNAENVHDFQAKLKQVGP